MSEKVLCHLGHGMSVSTKSQDLLLDLENVLAVI